jgi:hypothetical protein
LSGPVIRAAGVAGTFLYTLDTVPVEPPLYTLYSDPAKSQVAQAERPSVPVNAYQFTCSYDADLDPGLYYLTFRNRFTAEQPYVVDGDDELLLVDPAGVVGGSEPPIQRLRDMTGGAEGYTDSQLQNVLDRNTSALTGVVNYNLAAREVWSWLAAKYAQLVDTSESGSTRKLSDLHKHALTMVSQYTPADGVVEVVEPVRPRTRPIVRP